MKTTLTGITIIAFCFLYSTFIDKNWFVAFLFISGFVIFMIGGLKTLNKIIADYEKD